MALVQAKCTNCGANLEVDNSKDAAICPFCSTPYVIEKAINFFNLTANNIVINKGLDLTHEIEKADGYLKLGQIRMVYDIYNKILEEYPTNFEVRKLKVELLFSSILSQSRDFTDTNLDQEIEYLQKCCPSEQEEEIDRFIKDFFQKKRTKELETEAKIKNETEPLVRERDNLRKQIEAKIKSETEPLIQKKNISLNK